MNEILEIAEQRYAAWKRDGKPMSLAFLVAEDVPPLLAKAREMELAVRQEHGGRYYEPECPLCLLIG